MSVYIKGMEMPKSCPCELIGIGYDLCCSFAGGIPARVKEYYECCQNDTRPSWCPITPVHDHGRLIDAYALKSTVYEALKDAIHDDNATPCGAALCAFIAKHIVAEIESAPTIIPASGKEEQT